MSWLKKVSSISFWIDGSQKIAQPKDMSKLSNELIHFVYDKSGINVGVHAIMPDGDSFDQLVGDINWYVIPNIISEQDQVKLMQDWIREMQIMGFDIQMVGPEESGQNRWNNSEDNTLMVYRLRVLENGSADYPEIPEMNVSNDSARSLMGLLNIPFDHSGSLDLSALRQRLATATEARMNEFTTDPSDTQEEGGPRMIDFGVDFQRMRGYIDALTRIVDFGLQNGFTTLAWA